MYINYIALIKNEKKNTALWEQFTKSKSKILEWGNIDTPDTQIHDGLLLLRFVS
jgi:hypothetical protein